MRGKMNNHPEWGWGIDYVTEQGETNWVQLHPDNLNSIKEMENVFDNIEGRIMSQPYVMFDFDISKKMSGEIRYGKLKPKSYPCDLDHNGECLICDCLVDGCAYTRYLQGDFTYETEEELKKMFE